MSSHPTILFRIRPTTYGSGPYHPAILQPDGRRSVWYWSNITLETRGEAYDWAARAIFDAEAEAQLIVNRWNLSAL
jgi:hypothetical protein